MGGKNQVIAKYFPPIAVGGPVLVTEKYGQSQAGMPLGTAESVVGGPKIKDDRN